MKAKYSRITLTPVIDVVSFPTEAPKSREFMTDSVCPKKPCVAFHVTDLMNLANAKHINCRPEPHWGVDVFTIFIYFLPFLK